MEAPKPEEITHLPMDQLQGFEYCIDSNPSWGEAIALGFQHYILALGTAAIIPSILVPLMGGSDGDKVRVIQTLLFVGGINTLVQTLFGTRLPTVIGGSYAFIVPIMSIIHDSSLTQIQDPHLRFLQTMRAIQGALIVASSVQIVLGFSQLWGIFSRIFSPLGMVPVIALVGFGLFDRAFPLVGNCVEIGIPMLILFIGLSQYLKQFQAKHLPIFERFALVISITIIWAYAHLLTASGAYKHRPEKTQFSCRTDKANLISSAPWIKIPYPLQWGAPTFDAGHAFGMMAAVCVSLIESTAAYKAASRLASATPPPAHVLSRGIGWQRALKPTGKKKSNLKPEVEMHPMVPKRCKLLYKHAKTVMEPSGVALSTVLNEKIFGVEKQLYVLPENVTDLLEMNWIGQGVITAYMAYLHEMISEREDELDLYGFIDPSCTFEAEKSKTFKSYLVKRLKDGNADRIMFMPDNTGKHWILTIIWENEIYILDSMPRPSYTKWEKIVSDAVKMFNAETGRGNKVPAVKRLAGVPKQPGGYECGYYVMRYMKDIINDDTLGFAEKWAARIQRAYTEEELDEVRVEVGDFFSGLI